MPIPATDAKPDDQPAGGKPAGPEDGREKERGYGAAEPPAADPVDETSKESFPASDPPSWTPERMGAPDKSPGRHR